MKRFVAWMLVLLLCMGTFGLFACTPAGEDESENRSTEESQKQPVESDTNDQNASHKHDYEVLDSKDPTCVEAGYIVYGCKDCEDMNREELAATGEHVYSVHRFVGDGVYGFCAVCDEQGALVQTKAEVIAAIYEGTENRCQEVLAYGMPPLAVCEKVFEQFLDAGITGVVSGEYAFSTTDLSSFVEECEIAGLDIYVDLQGMDAASSYNVLRFLKRCDQLRNVKGIYLRDEPWLGLFPGLAATRDKIVEEIPEAENWLIGANMLPYGDPAFEPGNQFGDDAHGWYQGMLTYMETLHADYLSFDRYPWASNGTEDGSPEYYVSNLLVAKRVTDQYGVPLWTFLQTSPVGGYKAPTARQVRCETNLSLACGADTLLLFTAYQVSNHIGLIASDGSLTDTYWYVQEALEAVNAVKGVYMDFDTEKVVLSGCEKYASAIQAWEGASYLADSYRQLTAVESDGDILIGCSVDAEGRTGLYVVNTEYHSGAKESTVTLKLDGMNNYQLWSELGLEDIGTANELEFELEPGDFKFIILGDDNLAD